MAKRTPVSVPVVVLSKAVRLMANWLRNQWPTSRRTFRWRPRVPHQVWKRYNCDNRRQQAHNRFRQSRSEACSRQFCSARLNDENSVSRRLLRLSIFPGHITFEERNCRQRCLSRTVLHLSSVCEIKQRIVFLIIDARDDQLLPDQACSLGKTRSPPLPSLISPMLIGPVCSQEIDALDGSSNQLPFCNRSIIPRENDAR